MHNNSSKLLKFKISQEDAFLYVAIIIWSTLKFKSENNHETIKKNLYSAIFVLL